MEYLKKLLDLKQPMSENPTRFSNIVLVLKGARKLTGRNIESGIYEKNELNEFDLSNGLYHSLQFTGLINYLILLEQLGSIFKIKNNPTTSENGIFNALNEFSSLNNDSKIKSLIALRNSLVHKFSLATEKKPNKKELQHKFALSLERNSKIVQIPNTQWNGDFADKCDSSTTTIHLIDFAELAESVFLNINSQLEKGNLESRIVDVELAARYTIIY